MYPLSCVQQVTVIILRRAASQAFVEVNSLYSVSVSGHDGVSELRLQTGHGHRAVTHREIKLG